MLDLEAYLARIGVRGRPGLAAVHRAHVTSIPFENLDPHRGVPVSLAPEDLERKLVTERRGGYCFEHNLLLKAALEQLGRRVEPMLARVRIGAPPGASRPRSHLVLRVRADGAGWHADVGFGAGGPLEPIPFGTGGPYEQAGWVIRVVEDDRSGELVLQEQANDEWVDLYAFVPDPVPHVDIEVSNWYTCTSPRSPFVTGLVVASVDDGGMRTMLRGSWSEDGSDSGSGSGEVALTEDTPGASTVTPVARKQIPELLAERFGLSGFGLGEDGQVVAV